MGVVRKSHIELIGEDALIAMLKEFPDASFRRVLRPAMNTAAGFVVKAAKAAAGIYSDTRAYQKAIGKKSVTYPKNKRIVNIIGARRGSQFTKYDRYGRKRSPAYYAHLVEYGAKAHIIKVRQSHKGIFRKHGDNRIKTQGVIVHPGATARHPLRKAWAASKSYANSILVDEMAKRAPIEAKRLAAKAKKKKA